MRIGLVMIVLSGLAALSGCGADGRPVRPTAGIGVSLGSGGASLGGTLGVTVGGVTIRAGV